MPTIPDRVVKNFQYGVINRVEKESIPVGAASDSLNWLTDGDKIELRRGQQLLGTEVTGSGKITGLAVVSRFDGTEVPFMTYDRKIKAYISSSEDWSEVGTNTLPADANDEDIAIEEYHSLAGAFAYLSSKNSSIYKIPVANPTSVVDQSSTTHRGKIAIKQNRMFLWDRKDDDGGRDQTGLYGSYIDKDELSDFTEVTSENVGTGDGTTTNFTGTLAQRTGVRTVMYVRITDGTETFTDDRNGTLAGDQGGTGTINYATGVFDITFNTAPTNLQAITADYYWEDSTDNGICDFTKDTPRTAGQGFTFRQDDGGAEMQNLGSIGSVEYCFHVKKTWALTLSSDDTAATNLIYRSKVGIEYWRSMYESSDGGIYYIDSKKINDPKFRLLTFTDSNENILPKSISDKLKLDGYRFDKGVVFEFEPYVLFSGRTSDESINNRLFVYNKIWNSIDILDYRVSTMEQYDGSLIAGDSGSNNVFTLFSSLADEDSEIPNYWISAKDDLGVEGVKKTHRMVISGSLGVDQKIEVSIALDGGDFVEVGGSDDSDGNHTYALEGDGDYVDTESRYVIGSETLGRDIVGGGGGIEASPFRKEFTINTDKYSEIEIRFKAMGVGYISISEYILKDNRYKGRKISTKYLT